MFHIRNQKFRPLYTGRENAELDDVVTSGVTCKPNDLPYTHYSSTI